MVAGRRHALGLPVGEMGLFRNTSCQLMVASEAGGNDLVLLGEEDWTAERWRNKIGGMGCGRLGASIRSIPPFSATEIIDQMRA
jgi:hypothetical protein